jgi:hypothetical protein
MRSDTLDKPNRVWTNPDGEKDKPSLVCLKPEVLCLAIVPADDLEKTAAALADGSDVVAQNIPLARIAQLQGDEGDRDLSITYKQGEGKTDSVTITLADRAKRDELLDALRHRLGPTWTCDRQRVGRLSASWWPLGVTAGIAFVTWIMYAEAQQIAAGKQLKPVGGRAKTKLISQVMHWVEGLIGATGVLILGGVLASLGIVWLVYAVARPPVRVTVRPDKA